MARVGRVATVQRSLLSNRSFGDAFRRQLSRGASTQAEDPEPKTEAKNEPIVVPDKYDVDYEEYHFENHKTPTFTDAEKARLEANRPKVDPRLSTVFRGCTNMDEQGIATVPYSKRGWYKMKHIYGNYDESKPHMKQHSIYVIDPRSTYWKLVHHPVVLRKGALDYWKEKQEVDVCKRFQSVDTAKLATLGPELLAAHFVTSFGGKVKFHGFKNWFDNDNYKSLPQRFGPEFVCEAIDLSNTPLFYEGMSFLMRLSDLRSLNLTNCTALDEWAINRLYPLRETLVHLDLSGCSGIPGPGIATLWKMKKLRRLHLIGLDDSIANLPHIAMELEGQLPDLYVHGVDFERQPDLDRIGLADNYCRKDRELLEQTGGDVSKIDWQIWWKLGEGKDSDFDPDNFRYEWRDRPFESDYEDILEESKEELGWLASVLALDPRKLRKIHPVRRV